MRLNETQKAKATKVLEAIGMLSAMTIDQIVSNGVHQVDSDMQNAKRDLLAGVGRSGGFVGDSTMTVIYESKECMVIREDLTPIAIFPNVLVVFDIGNGVILQSCITASPKVIKVYR